MNAAKQGSASAQCKLGICYLEGKDVQQNFIKAVYWLKKKLSIKEMLLRNLI